MRAGVRTFLPALAASLLVATTAAAQQPTPPATAATPPATSEAPPATAATPPATGEAPPARVEAHIALGDTPSATVDAHFATGDDPAAAGGVHVTVGAAPAPTGEQKAPAAEDHDDFIEHTHPGFGARVGGYGFWTPTKTIWDDCPMAGVGLFGTLDVTKNLFVEAAIDQYDSVPFLGDSDAPSMSRVSFLASGAIGLRMFPEFIIVPHVQLGAGMEWTRFEQATQKIEGIYPMGFLSMGGELNVFKHIKAGADLRFLGMAKPYEDQSQGSSLKMEMMPAAQGLFYARYVL
jgi:hypothetical protein